MNTDKIKELVKLFEESQISKMDISEGNLHITLEKDLNQVIVHEPKDIKSQDIQKEIKGEAIKSPLVGTYYQARGANQAPFVKAGDHIHEGDVVCIIEAMKVMNEIKSTVDGTVLSINVHDGEPVEFDQPLMWIG